MARLETRFLGITFPNPFLLAAGPPTANGAMIIKGFDAGWGGAVTKTIALEPTEHPSPRVFVVKSGRDKRGMVDIELFSDLTLDRWEEEIDSIRASYPQRPIIASIAGGGSPRDWQEVIRRLEPHGVYGYEMNVSCPNFSKAKMGGKLGQDPKALESAVRWVREATDLPVIVKLTPNVTDIVALARVAAEAGADAVTATNSLIGLGGIDLDTFAPLPTVDGIGIFGGYGGPGLKPVSLRCAASIAQALPIPIIGCGGIANWHDAAESLAVGASMVAVCTAVMWNGRQIVEQMTKGLREYLRKKGYAAPADITGKALSRVRAFPDLNLSAKLTASIDEGRCNGCAICVRACESGGFQAIWIDKEIALVDPHKCDGCGLCVGVCPLRAVHMVPRQVMD